MFGQRQLLFKPFAFDVGQYLGAQRLALGGRFGLLLGLAGILLGSTFGGSLLGAVTLRLGGSLRFAAVRGLSAGSTRVGSSGA